MKNLMIAILLLVLPLSLFAQNKSIKKFYHSYKRGEDVSKFMLPRPMIIASANFGQTILAKEDIEVKEALKFARNSIKNIRFLIVENSNKINSNKTKLFMADLRRAKYEELFFFREGESKGTVMIQEKNGKIKNMFILFQEEEELIMMNIKTKIKKKHITALVKSMMKVYKDRKVEKNLPVKEVEEINAPEV